MKLMRLLQEASTQGVGENGSSGGESDTSVGEKLLSTLLTEMDGLELAQGVLVLAATNRPQAIDAALMRPERFDLVLYVPPPDKETRLEILRILTTRNTLADDVDLEVLADSTDCFTGAEFAGLCREAAMAALIESLATNLDSKVVCSRHFDSARNGTRASLTPLQIASFANFFHCYETEHISYYQQQLTFSFTVRQAFSSAEVHIASFNVPVAFISSPTMNLSRGGRMQ